jgi:hypothetical protein
LATDAGVVFAGSLYTWNLNVHTRPLVQRAIEAINSTDEDTQYVGAIVLLFVAMAAQARIDRFSTQELVQIVSALEKAQELMVAKKMGGNLTTFRGTVKGFRAELQSRQNVVWDKALEFFSEHKLASSLAVYPAFMFVVWLVMLWWCPLVLLKINETLKATDIPVPILGEGVKFPARALLSVNFLHYHPRVLDAWVSAHIESVRERFSAKPTVTARRVHVRFPVVVDGDIAADFGPEILRPYFTRQRVCVLIWGEGGSGKTSLACQVAQWAMSDDPQGQLCKHHRMLPVLIEHEFDGEATERKTAFLNAIQGQLQDLTDEAEPIPVELVEKLLRRKRVLVIVDHLSEMSETTRNAIHPRLSSFAVNALIVTSRNEESLGGMSTTTLQPLRITGSDETSSFMAAYLAQRGKRALFTLPEFFDGCRQLAIMVGTREITILLARLYADQMVATKEAGELHVLPKNIPELMLAYLNELNRDVTENKLNDRMVHHNAKVIAWECVRNLFRPTSASVDHVLEAFGTKEAIVWLKYLEDRLHLIQSIQPAQEHIRFLLDPLAEYLAALHLLDACGNDEKLWHTFLEEYDKKTEVLGAIQPFLTAVHDCCLVKSKQLEMPDFVIRELAIRIGA